MKQRFHRLNHRQFRGKMNKAYLEGEMGVSWHIFLSIQQQVFVRLFYTLSSKQTYIDHDKAEDWQLSILDSILCR